MVAEATLNGTACATCKHQDCDGSKGYSHFIFDGEDVKQCALTFATEETTVFMGWYRHYKAGYLLEDGAILDQPNMFLKVVEVLEATVQDYEEEERKKAERNSRRG